MLLTVTQVTSKYKWLYFKSSPHDLAHFQTFDEASRGPLGALGLVVRRNKSAGIALVAAIVVLASLVVDPFVQLVFSFPNSATIDPQGTASLHEAVTYDIGANGNFAGTILDIK